MAITDDCISKPRAETRCFKTPNMLLFFFFFNEYFPGYGWCFPLPSQQHLQILFFPERDLTQISDLMNKYKNDTTSL